MKTGRVFESISERTINKNMEQPSERHEEDDLIFGRNINHHQNCRSDQAVADIISDSAYTVVNKISNRTDIKYKEDNEYPVPGKLSNVDIKDERKQGGERVFHANNLFHEYIHIR